MGTFELTQLRYNNYGVLVPYDTCCRWVAARAVYHLLSQYIVQAKTSLRQILSQLTKHRVSKQSIK